MFGESSDNNDRVPVEMEQFDESMLRLSHSTTTSFTSSKPVPDIHPYLEIGKSLQNLRRSVFDMYKDEVNKSVRSTDRNSPPMATATYQSSAQHYEYNYLSQQNEIIHKESLQSSLLQTPPSASHGSSDNQHSGSKQTPQNNNDSAKSSKNRVSTPYRHNKGEYSEINRIPHFNTADLNDSTEELSPMARTTRSSRNNSGLSPRLQSTDFPQHQPSQLTSGSFSEQLSHRFRHTEATDGASQADSDETDSSREEISPHDVGATTAASASVEVSHAIAVIVGQHEERFVRYV